MNIEVEIKARIKNYSQARKAVLAKGKFIKKVHQIDTYYTSHHRNYYTEKPLIDYMRTRETKNSFTLEFHQGIYNKKGIKIRSEEREIEIHDKKTMVEILKLMEFKKVVIIDKKREYFLCGNFEIAMDFVKGLGSFIEVEAKNPKMKMDDCQKFLDNLGIKHGPIEEDGYPLLMLSKKNIKNAGKPLQQ